MSKLPEKVPKRIEVISHLLLILTGITAWIFFKLLNRTIVIGRENINHHSMMVLVVSNHLSLFDSLLVGLALCFPRIILYPRFAPWHTPDADNFFRAKLFGGRSRFLRKILTPFATFLFVHLKCIPLERGRTDRGTLMRIKDALVRGIVHYFPEGTRSRTGKLGEGKEGVGEIIHDLQPKILPVYLEGIQKVFPIGAKLPRLGKKVLVVIGKPFRCEEFKGRPNNRETRLAIAQKVMAQIAALAPCPN